MNWNHVPKATHVGLDVLSAGVHDAIANFNIAEKAALDIMELLKINSGYYTAKCCRSVKVPRKHSSIYRMLEQQKKHRKKLSFSKKNVARQKHWNYRNLIWKGELLESSTSYFISLFAVLLFYMHS